MVDTDMQFLYKDGDFWHFMMPDTFEQYTAGAGRGRRGRAVAEGRRVRAS